MSLHGITPAAVTNAKSFAKAYGPLSQILSKFPVFHQSPFDVQAIEQSCVRYRLPNIQAKWFDTIDIFKKCWPELAPEGYNLKRLCSLHNINIKHHDAGQDALATAQLLSLAINKTTLKLPLEPIQLKQPGVFFGQSVVFTGDMNKNELEAMAKSIGFEIGKGVTSTTSYLCVGKTDQRTLDSGNTKSGKQKKAEELIQSGFGIKIISENLFRAILK